MFNIKEKLHNGFNRLKEKTKKVLIILGIVSVCSAAGGGAILDQQANPYEKIEDRFEIQLPEQARISVSENKPELYLGKWNDECFVKIGFPTQSSNKVSRIPFTNKLEWQDGNNKVHMYPIENGFEYDIILEEKPISNIQTLSMQTKGLKFYYQPPLTEEITEEQKAKGWTATETDIKDEKGNIVCHRPENVVGSYAVYHESKSGDYSQMGLKNYRAGKAFHWYRIKAWDKTGTEVWCKLNIDIDKGVRTVETPQDFLDNAVYPVVVDDIFGYYNGGTPGESFWAGDDYIMGAPYTITGDGTVDSISAYISHFSLGASSVRYVIYKDSDNSRIDYCTTEVEAPGSADWTINSSLSGASLVSSTIYKLGIWFESARLYYDSGVTGFYDKETYHATNPPINPLVPSNWTNHKVSIYCTYTAGGGAARRIIITQ